MHLVRPPTPIVDNRVVLQGDQLMSLPVAMRFDAYPYCQPARGIYELHVMICDNEGDLVLVDAGWDDENEYCRCLEAAAQHKLDILHYAS